MSSTPTSTPSRRRAAPETPGSARSTTSTAGDRTTLLDRTEELDLAIHDLRRQISAERSRRHRPSTSLTLSFLDPTLTASSIKATLLEKLRSMDDDALTSLLTASTSALGRFVGGEVGEVLGEMVPSKTVGVEGVGSASEMDRRLGSSEAKEAWVQIRQQRLASLLSHLSTFTLLEIDTLTTTSPSRDTRRIRLNGNVARLYPLDLSFDVVDSGPSPQVQKLTAKLPPWLVSALDNPHKQYTKALKRNDLPCLLLMLRTMVPLAALRRNLFVWLMQTYTALARDHVRSWETEYRVDFTPYHPGASSGTGRNRKGMDEILGRSLLDPIAAERFTLTNARGALLTAKFAIRWNRFGHAYPVVSAVPDVPRDMVGGSETFLRGFEEETLHLLRVAIDSNGLIGLPDQDDEEELGEGVGRWGVGAALAAVIKAFFRLDEGAAGESESGDE
ncbi:hypothetical protein PSEUBRA_000188 [Kalmanozyma brasiliensis GHG001]|uniref:Uncharacterized protein n=1 Tax=Kalmanozyma brasiliensis (strain GHG001) TaxID=1365824 RepID=V5F0H5_KALBG|nr:uncharacterized protein PSEUBRA_000188 [Kalmanozyma brasiliensis GHG001]EST09803.1 hypothetical protein PSEUBRA_000188 [Kalmanozyma brasiliensis GHG001]